MNILKASAALAIGLFALNATAANDIANFNRYADDNRRIMELPESESRVVFMGNSITDFWPTNRPEFFVVILAGTNDIPNNAYNEERTLGNILSMAELHRSVIDNTDQGRKCRNRKTGGWNHHSPDRRSDL